MSRRLPSAKLIAGGGLSVRPLSGKTALVTGGGKRIGREVALALARAGANVAVTFHKSGKDASATAQAIEKLGARSLAFELDVRNEDSVYLVVQSVAAIFGGLDLLINNAAVFESAPLDEISVDAWDRTFETNTRGPFLTSREALPFLKDSRGRIINLGSLGGNHPWTTHAHYCASKAALHMLTQTMAKAFAPQVSVNCVAPGYIEFESGAAAAQFAKKTPMGRNGAAADVAEAVLFFATGPHFITGQILNVDGGLGL
jgi:NAD(P)-dependent dehydrogenase (short-subunit alcohol dehydrogenase family)